ncbi:acetylglutamate kinase [Kiloniella laminariae]|uniref:Acetylglutamate kinase n=1 Tax=Kiloniella laminariae TaxID=454162 RepID=A0ABT4LKG5_9PROT|nr:acetylglutamate kinase [Kiloniella laminariae]MCZ4281599.1 acetylglutamate kinase [Kiloniella laminariae]
MLTNHAKDPRKWLRTAGTISEALPFMRRYSGKTIVIKYGGHAMGNSELADIFARDIVLLKQVGINPIVVHGGGPQIGDMLKRMAVNSEFVDGLRVTDEATVEIVEMVLSGRINKSITAAINKAGGTAIGISGKDGSLIKARKLQRTVRDPDSNIEKVLDLGFVGEPDEINPEFLQKLETSGMIPVIAPIGFGADGETYNINADTAAGAIAAAVGASRLLMMTDVAGVLDKEGVLIPEITFQTADELRRNGTISGGMIPKIETCISTVEGGVNAAVILDGRVPHGMLLEIFTDCGIGTLIKKD